jgi:hypothetical protein
MIKTKEILNKFYLRIYSMTYDEYVQLNGVEEISYDESLVNFVKQELKNGR